MNQENIHTNHRKHQQEFRWWFSNERIFFIIIVEFCSPTDKSMCFHCLCFMFIAFIPCWMERKGVTKIYFTAGDWRVIIQWEYGFYNMKRTFFFQTISFKKVICVQTSPDPRILKRIVVNEWTQKYRTFLKMMRIVWLDQN